MQRRDHQLLRLGAAAGLVVFLAAHAALLSRFPWFVDETTFASFAQASAGDPSQRFAALVDHKGLLTTWLGALFIHLGAGPVEALRIVAGLGALLAAAATGLLAHRWRGPACGAAAFLLTLFVPYLFVHGMVGVHDAAVAGGSMLALWLQVRLAQQPTAQRGIALGITFGALLLTKPTGALTIALLPASLLCAEWPLRGRSAERRAWAMAAGTAVLVGLAIAQLPRVSPLSQTPVPNNFRTPGDLLSDPFGTVHLIAPGAWDAFAGYLTLPVLLAAAWGLAVAARDRDRLLLLCGVWAAAAIAAYLLLTDWAYPRYGLQAVAPLCLLAVAGGRDLALRFSPRIGRPATAALVAAALLPAALFDLRVVREPGTAPYPGLDRTQYVQSDSNTEPLRQAGLAIRRRAPEISSRSPRAERIIMLRGAYPWALRLTTGGRTWSPDPPFFVVDGYAQPALARRARFTVVDGPQDLREIGLTREQRIGRWERPGGPAVELYDRRATGR